jgi:invasion protein IalB
MKPLRAAIAAIAILTPLAVQAAGPSPIGPNKGRYGDWIAATYGSGSEKICYAFTMAIHTRPHISSRGIPMLTVTERHGSRDEISLTPGYKYPRNPTISLQAGKTKIPFDVQDNVGFTDNVSPALAAFTNESTATAISSGPKGTKTVTDSYSLNGFSAAYKAIVKACP